MRDGMDYSKLGRRKWEEPAFGMGDQFMGKVRAIKSMRLLGAVAAMLWASRAESKPVFLVQPTDQAVFPTQHAIFSCYVVTDRPPHTLTVQWYDLASGQPVPLGGGGAVLDVLALSDAPWGTGPFYCEACDQDGCVDSNQVQLILDATPPPPVITLQPQDITVIDPQPIAVTIQASGLALPFRFDWSVITGFGPQPEIGLDGTSMPDPYTFILYTRTARFGLSAKGAAVIPSGMFYCDVTDAAGQTVRSNTITVTILDPASASDSSQFVDSSVPPQLTAGQFVFGSAAMKNTSGASWTTDQGYALAITDDSGGNLTGGLAWIDLPDPLAVVRPGETAQFLLPLSMPLSPGDYSFHVQMMDGESALFGETGMVQVKVSAPPNSAVDWPLYE